MVEALASLGLAASIIAVIQIAEDVIKLCAEYASSVKNAQSDMHDICTECESVQSVLYRLHGMCMDPKFRQQMPTLQVLIEQNGPLPQYLVKLQEIAAQLQLPKGWKRTAEILKWPTKAKDIEKALQIMQRKKALLTLAISLDSASLSTVLAADLSAAARRVDGMSDNITAMSENVAVVVNAADVAARDSLYKDIIRWLSPPDPASKHNDACKKRHPGTGKWFLEGDAIQRWKNQPGSFLWLHGIRSGKSILWYPFSFERYRLLKSFISSSIIEEITECFAGLPAVAVVYFYFDFNDKNPSQPDNLLRSLIVQHLTSLSTVPESISLVYKEHRDGRQASTKVLLTILRGLFELYKECYVLLDAFDECADQTELIRIITEIFNWKLGNLHVLITSRKERHISDILGVIATEETNIQGPSVDSDISVYIRERLQNDPPLSKWPNDVREEIAHVLATGAQGMFRWVACQLDSLTAFKRLGGLREALHSLPKDLDETYHRILSKISKDDEKDVKRVLQWLAFSARPMRLDEVAEVMAIEYSDSPRFNPKQRFCDPLDILTICSSLVTLSQTPYYGFPPANIDIGEIRLAHYSVKEYLLSERIRNSQSPVPHYSLLESNAHQVIAETCLIYLLHFEDESFTLNMLESFPLAHYAAVNWPFHAGFENDDILPNLHPLLLRLFNSHCNQFSNWIRIRDGEDRYEYRRYFLHKRIQSTTASPFYVSCELGFSAVVKHLADSGADVNAQGGPYGNGLQAAVRQKHEAVVRVLLENGADVNAKSGEYGNALQAAAAGDNKAIVRVLLEKGADVNGTGGKYGNALQAAVREKREAVVRILLEKGANVNASGGEYGNALQAAAVHSNKAIVMLLLEKGADVNASGKYRNALHAAALRGDEAIVRVLLENGADANALHAAALRGNEAIVRLLLDKGADVNASGGEYGNALQAAAVCDNKAIVRVLLEKGADVNASGGKYGNALHAAAFRGNDAIVRVLLDKGADVNASGGKYGNALQAAVSAKYGVVVNMLLENGADANARGGEYGNALHAASVCGNEAIVRVLLEKGADINASGGKYGNALQAAAFWNNGVIVEVLLEKGADVNAKGGKYGNALQGAVHGGGEAIVKVLLEKGADVNAKGGKYGSALQAATLRKDDAIVRVLLDSGADENLRDA